MGQLEISQFLRTYLSVSHKTGQISVSFELITSLACVTYLQMISLFVRVIVDTGAQTVWEGRMVF